MNTCIMYSTIELGGHHVYMSVRCFEKGLTGCIVKGLTGCIIHGALSMGAYYPSLMIDTMSTRTCPLRAVQHLSLKLADCLE